MPGLARAASSGLHRLHSITAHRPSRMSSHRTIQCLRTLLLPGAGQNTTDSYIFRVRISTTRIESTVHPSKRAPALSDIDARPRRRWTSPEGSRGQQPSEPTRSTVSLARLVWKSLPPRLSWIPASAGMTPPRPVPSFPRPLAPAKAGRESTGGHDVEFPCATVGAGSLTVERFREYDGRYPAPPPETRPLAGRFGAAAASDAGAPCRSSTASGVIMDGRRGVGERRETRPSQEGDAVRRLNGTAPPPGARSTRLGSAQSTRRGGP